MNWSQRPMATPFFARLRRSPAVGPIELAALAALPVEIRAFAPHAGLAVEGQRVERIHVLLDGWAARAKILENGSRQIPALFIPGDVCDLDALQFGRGHCGVIALTRCTAALLPREPLLELLDRHRALRDAFARMVATELAGAMQWTVCLGRRSARERLAHLLCEMCLRLEAAGLARDRACAFPLTQEEIADVLGLTAVHVNRTLQALRGDGLIHLREQRLTIADWAALRRESGFDPAYLHLADAPPAPGVVRAIATGTEMRLSA